MTRQRTPDETARASLRERKAMLDLLSAVRAWRAAGKPRKR